VKADKQKVVIGASVLTAVVASLCCIGPLLAVLLGVSGLAAASAFAKWRPLFLLVTFAFLALAWYLAYRKPKTSCAGDAACATNAITRWNKLVLWVTTVFVAAVAAFPLYSGAVARWLQPSPPAQSRVSSAQTAELRVNVVGMHCPACAAGLEASLKHRDGVELAQVSFDSKEARVRYDPQKISASKITEVVNESGFQVERKQQ
jgi:mercuric ion transport protein